MPRVWRSRGDIVVGVIVIVTLVAIAVVAVLGSSRSDPPRATPPPPPPAGAPAPPRATPPPPNTASPTTTRAAATSTTVNECLPWVVLAASYTGALHDGMDQLVALVDDGHHSLLQGVYDQTKDTAERALVTVPDMLDGCGYPPVPTSPVNAAGAIADLDEALARWGAVGYICRNAADFATNAASLQMRTTARAFSALRC